MPKITELGTIVQVTVEHVFLRLSVEMQQLTLCLSLGIAFVQNTPADVVYLACCAAVAMAH